MNYRSICMVMMCGYAGIIGAVDLEQGAQDWVINTKQIKLDGYPHAFNPSIIRWQGRLLMCFRVIPDAKQPFTSWLGLVWLDEEFNPVGDIQQLQLRDPLSPVPSRVEDGRLIMVNDTLYLVYSDNEDPVITRGGFRVFIAQLQEDGGLFQVAHKEKLSVFEGNDELKREKNWVPFVYKGQLLLAYSLTPHRILAPIVGTNSCTTLASSFSDIEWQWGELRGGTPALAQDDHYLGFFHSCIGMNSVHCPKFARHYFMGAYRFSSQAPFAITHMSKTPIIGKNFYHGASYKPYWGTVQAVFPGGFIADENYVWIVFGRQDHEMWVTQLDKKKLYESLVPCDVVDDAEKYGFENPVVPEGTEYDVCLL